MSPRSMLECHAVKRYMDMEEQPLIFINPMPGWSDFRRLAHAVFV